MSWSHYVELLTIDDDLERHFYEQQCINENWSIRELKRQIDSALFQRVALGKDKNGVFELSKKGILVSKAEDVVKDPYVLEFLEIPEDYKYSEKELEQKIIDPIGIILSTKKGKLLVKYAKGGISNKLFVSRYKLYMPDKKELQNKLKEIIRTSKLKPRFIKKMKQIEKQKSIRYGYRSIPVKLAVLG